MPRRYWRKGVVYEMTPEEEAYEDAREAKRQAGHKRRLKQEARQRAEEERRKLDPNGRVPQVLQRVTNKRARGETLTPEQTQREAQALVVLAQLELIDDRLEAILQAIDDGKNVLTPGKGITGAIDGAGDWTTS